MDIDDVDEYDYLFKFIVIGDAASGKSCILHKFTTGKFKDTSTHTIGVEFGSKVCEVGGKLVKEQIWDTAGQERFRSVTRSYYRGTAGCLLVYDITNRESYNNVPHWLDDARKLATSDLVICLVGNKVDLADERKVTFLEASRYATENDIMFLETSAKSGDNIEEAFHHCSKTILNKILQGVIQPDAVGSGIQLSSTARRNRRSRTPEAEERDSSDCQC
eukprot:TRINITY_DN4465_c0_g1_i2.p1 TRINITY_DN4465_c0_g1~~TRINITY_DN4465_c0_g1_i2.p1  ORF type:complete len:219 (+),score=51.55 TRINITY_DN4465_c0_g1_i2:39-695(+)